MAKLQRLNKCGSSIQVTIPRPLLYHLGWHPGDYIVPELTEGGGILIRPPRTEDFRPRLPLHELVPAGAGGLE